ncbi:hypothetical protein [Jeotgalibaca arthritidis]|uniref:hypothetical protein n=1 Tax=Jeotgalibaca arthritidis TaxID=1868794 RepID=UPI0035A142EF
MNVIANKRGSILPLVLVGLFLTQLCFFSVCYIYKNQAETYQLLKEHYQSQSMLLMTEQFIKEGEKENVYSYNIGDVSVSYERDRIILTSCLNTGYQGNLIITIEE